MTAALTKTELPTPQSALTLSEPEETAASTAGNTVPAEDDKQALPPMTGSGSEASTSAAEHDQAYNNVPVDPPEATAETATEDSDMEATCAPKRAVPRR